MKKHFNSTSTKNIQGALNDYPCGGGAAQDKWLHIPLVKEALHVDKDAHYFTGGFNYTFSEKNLLPFYKHVIENTNLRVLIYNGDTDALINSFMAQNWTSYLGYNEKESWRPWTVDGKSYVGGYVTRYEHDFDYLTIRGAGHMVPNNKPREAYSFITTFINNQEYPKYNPNMR